jgi:hypothetical protein
MYPRGTGSIRTHAYDCSLSPGPDLDCPVCQLQLVQSRRLRPSFCTEPSGVVSVLLGRRRE